MPKELPLHIFIRNSIILSLFFLIISGIIIEKRKLQDNEDFPFDKTILEHPDIIDYDINNSEIDNSINTYKYNIITVDSLVAETYTNSINLP